jgi:hypothetical protein
MTVAGKVWTLIDLSVTCRSVDFGPTFRQSDSTDQVDNAIVWRYNKSTHSNP